MYCINKLFLFNAIHSPLEKFIQAWKWLHFPIIFFHSSSLHILCPQYATSPLMLARSNSSLLISSLLDSANSNMHVHAQYTIYLYVLFHGNHACQNEDGTLMCYLYIHLFIARTTFFASLSTLLINTYLYTI